MKTNVIGVPFLISQAFVFFWSKILHLFLPRNILLYLFILFFVLEPLRIPHLIFFNLHLLLFTSQRSNLLHLWELPLFNLSYLIFLEPLFVMPFILSNLHLLLFTSQRSNLLHLWELPLFNLSYLIFLEPLFVMPFILFNLHLLLFTSQRLYIS